MTTIARALAGESLDALVWRVTGGGRAAVEATLRDNPGLAMIATALPADHPVALAEVADTPDELSLVQLWD